MNVSNISELTLTLKNSLKSRKLIFNFISTFQTITYFIAGIHFKKVSSKCKTLKELVYIAQNYKFFPIKFIPYFIQLKANQNSYELFELIKSFLRFKPKVVLEIGTCLGGTLFLLAKISNPNAHIISLDLPGGKYGGGYDRSRVTFYKFFKKNNQKLSCIRKNSHEQSTINGIKKLLKNQKVDLLFIDGDHTYKGVKKDFQRYSPLVNKNGKIIFHDIVMHHSYFECEVNIFWNEIKEKYKYEEIVENWNQKQHGIGILHLT